MRFRTLVKGRVRSRRVGRTGLALSLAALALLAVAPMAQASFHEIKVREVFPSTGEGSYVEVQMYNAGQNLVGGHALLTVYDSAGNLAHTAPMFASNVTKSANQSFILIGDTDVQTEQGDAPDLVDSGLNLSAAAGAVCWNAGGITTDCVSWGAFTGNANLPSPAGTPASGSGITAGKAIRRSITANCATMLESSDDTGNSSTDFAEVGPDPHNNAFTPLEMPCAGAPDTVIDTGPANLSHTKSQTASFTFHSVPAGATFECNLDEGGFGACPGSYTNLGEEEHEFEVRAVSGASPDPTPAVRHWTVDLTPPTTTIDEPKPASPNPGASVVFKFHASETSTFQCSLAKEPAADSFTACSSPKTYLKLADGSYVFKVKATDLATNEGTAVSYPFTVEGSAKDTDPPETTLKTHPTDPTESAIAAFTYESSEPESTFECKLDAGAFAACQPSGISYADLPPGPHSFQVKAKDSSGNTDESPAGFSWTIATPPGPHEEPPPPPPEEKPAPDTKITTKPGAKSHDRTPTIKFKATVGGATYQCRVDRGAFKSCRSPLTTKKLSFGRHTVKVRAIAGGLTDPSPASVSFKIVKGR